MSNQANNKPDDTLALFVMVSVVIGVLLWFGIPLFKEYSLTLSLWQMKLIALIVPTETNLQLLHKLQTVPSYEWDFFTMASAYYQIKYYFIWIPVLLIYGAVHFIKRNLYIVKKYNKVYTVESLLQQEKKVWAFLEPIAHENLLHADIVNGKWASAKKPKEFAQQYKLLNNPKDYSTLNEKRAAQVFAAQLGRIYTGIDDLTVVEKALVGVFAAHYIGNGKHAQYALLDMAKSHGLNQTPNYQPGLDLLEQVRSHKQFPAIEKIMARHAYVKTALMALFEVAGERGIMITKYFLWLKVINRPQYYALNNVGRETSWIECAGAWDHFQHEKALGEPMLKVFVESAVAGLDENLKRTKYLEAQ